MDAVIRRYAGPGARELFAFLEKSATDVQVLMRNIDGFVSYTLARTEEGGFSVTVFLNKKGIDESLAKAREWVAKNAAHIGPIEEPEVIWGKVIG